MISTTGYFDGRCSHVHIHVKRTSIADIPQVGAYYLGRYLLLK